MSRGDVASVTFPTFVRLEAPWRHEMTRSGTTEAREYYQSKKIRQAKHFATQENFFKFSDP